MIKGNRGRKLTFWKSGKLFKHKRLPEVKKLVEEEGKKAASEALETKRQDYFALIKKEAAELLTPTQREIIRSAGSDDSPSVQVLLIGELLCSLSAASKIVEEIVDHERKQKARPNKQIMKWAVKYQLELADKLDIARKLNEGLHEMVHGKKSVSVQVQAKPSINEHRVENADTESDTIGKGFSDTDGDGDI
jgi:hypothetical protein